MAPLFPLGVKVELLLNGSWNDISSYLYQRDTINITGGRTEQGDTATPAQMTFTVNNRDGRFSPYYTSGAYYPYLKRNVKVRLQISDTSSSGNTYTGYRFTGEVSEWPPLSDISGDDVYVQVVASGPLRRIRRGGGRGSALTRYYGTLTGSFAPVAYWPCEEDPDSSTLGPGVEGGSNMTVTGTPKFKALDKFNGSHPVAVVNKSVWTGATGSFGTSGDERYTTPGMYPWVASTSTVDVRCQGGGAGGSNGSNGVGGGGGEWRSNSAVAVTPGSLYYVVVGAGGTGGAGSYTDVNTGSDGEVSSFAGDAVSVIANGGSHGVGATGGVGGTGGTGTVGRNGGAGGSNAPNNKGGAGGGGGAGSAAAGNAGNNTSGCSGQTGGAAVTDGGKGGNGGDGCASPQQGFPGAAPGGGGGGGGDSHTGYNWAGGTGGSGQVRLIYTGSGGGTLPNNNVIRFVMYVPQHGGNDNKVLLRIATSGTIARLDVLHVNTGLVQLKGYDSGLALLFTSSTLTAPNGTSLMIGVELAKSGTAVAWKMNSIVAGDSAVLGTVSGSQATASVGNVTTVTVDPNSDITKTAIGHISVQYALIPITRVSKALHGHHTEMGIDRFIRLATEEALSNAVEFAETDDHWGFETGTQSWVGTNCTLTSSSVAVSNIGGDTIFTNWPVDGTKSLLMTASGGAQPTATSPVGTSGRPVNVGDIVTVNAEFYAPVTHNNVFVGLRWFNAAGTFISETDSADTVVTAAEIKTIKVKDTAPTNAAFFCVKVGNHNTDANNTLLYCDHVRVHPRMGPQTAKEYHKFLEEIEALDQGIMKEARDLWGLKYRTRIRLLNQAVALTLPYNTGTVSPPLAPVIDDKQTKNDITVTRHKGSSIRVTLDSGDMSVVEPPGGAGRHKRHLQIAAEADEQLAALASHLLGLNTTPDERYPTITVNLARAGIVNNAVAPLMSAIAAVEIGDRIQVTNLPFFYPNATADQLVIGYTETINSYEWTVTWNCTPFKPYVQVVSTIRRW